MPYSGGPMTEAMYYVLLALMNPSHGYQLMRDIEEVSHSRLKIGPGTLYGVLSRMEKDGLIKLDAAERRRKVYRITSDGKAALRVEYKRLSAMVLDGAVIGGSEING